MKRLEEMSDEALMVSYAQGEFPAFQELYDRHSGKALGFLLKRLSNTGEAEDLLQTVYMKLHQSKDSYNPKYPFLVWFFTVTRNVVIDHLRKKKNIPVETDALNAMLDERQAEGSGGDWNDAIRSLPEAQRQILERRFAEGLSFEEIAEKTGISEAGVRKRVSRAVQSLKKALGGS